MVKRLLCVALVALALAAPARSAEPPGGQAAGEPFRSPTLGFEVVKPAAWRFLIADQNLENLKRTTLEDADVQAALARYATAPLVAMMKYAEPFDDLNPSFKVNVKPLGALAGAPPTAVLELLLPQLQRSFRAFAVVDGPRVTTVSGRPAGYARFHYDLALPDGRTFPTASELWIVPRGGYFFMIGAGTRQDEKTGTRAEIQAILSSVRISGE